MVLWEGYRCLWQPFNGVVKDEANTGYLGVFNKDVPRDWVEPNPIHGTYGTFAETTSPTQPSNYAFKALAIGEGKFSSAMDVVKIWGAGGQGYRARCMCGSFAQQVTSAADVDIGPMDMRFATPRNLYHDNMWGSK